MIAHHPVLFLSALGLRYSGDLQVYGKSGPFPEAPDIPSIPVCQGYLWNGPCLCVCVYLWAWVHAWCVLYMSVSMCPCIKMILNVWV